MISFAACMLYSFSLVVLGEELSGRQLGTGGLGGDLQNIHAIT